MQQHGKYKHIIQRDLQSCGRKEDKFNIKVILKILYSVIVHRPT